MGENNYSKFLYFALFLVLAGISCWATSESFRLLLPTWPSAICWALTIAFFIVASFGTKMIVDSVNQNIYMENRGTKLVSGLLIALFFWLICSFPTNTHTFFYRNYIDDKVNTDISQTQGYLAQIKNNTVVDELIQAKTQELERDVNIRLGELKSEIENSANPGFGTKSKEILASFADILGVARIEPLSIGGSSLSKQGRQILYEAYRQKILTLMETKKENIKLSLMPTNKEYRKVAENDYKNLNLVRKYIQDGTLDVNTPMDIKTICDKLNKGYNTINTYKQYVHFQNDDDKARYTTDNPETRVKRMLNVFDVWHDFINGEFPGSFIYWIILSLLVDIAAFICFDLTFKRNDY